MIDLNKIINDSLIKIESEGYAEKVVEEKIKKTLSSVIDDCLSTYSPFGKNLKTEVEAKLNINLKELDFTGYNALVLNTVREKLGEVIMISGIEKINEAMNKMLADIKPEYTLSEIIESLKEYKGRYKEYGERITLFIESSNYSDGYVDIYFSEGEQDGKYGCEYRMRIDPEGKLWNAKVTDRDLSKNNVLGALFGIEALMFKIYATGARVIIDMDVDDYDLSYHNED